MKRESIKLARFTLLSLVLYGLLNWLGNVPSSRNCRELLRKSAGLGNILNKNTLTEPSFGLLSASLHNSSVLVFGPDDSLLNFMHKFV